MSVSVWHLDILDREKSFSKEDSVAHESGVLDSDQEVGVTEAGVIVMEEADNDFKIF